MRVNIDNINEIKEENRILDITDSNKVIRSTDLIPNQRQIKKEDVDEFVKEFKKKHSMRSVVEKEEIKEEELQTEKNKIEIKEKDDSPVILKNDNKNKPGRPKVNENNSLLET